MTDRPHRRILVWMRRALRLQDNSALWSAVQDADLVLPLVCLKTDPAYLRDTPRRRYVRGALRDLDDNLRGAGSRLFVSLGDPLQRIPAVAAAYRVDAVYAAEVCDPQTRARDERIAAELRGSGIAWKTFKDIVAFDGTDVLAADGSPYKVFTAYKRSWLVHADDVPRPLPRVRAITSPQKISEVTTTLTRVPGFSAASADSGETSSRKRLKRFINVALGDYKHQRDLPGIEGTSKLSPALSHGTISIREVYWAARGALDGAGSTAKESIETFIAELIWREFYYQVLANFPRVVETAFREEFASLRWSENKEHFDRWCSGVTGYPIVDAGMRQLNAEGWMHNRSRMIVASFLTKDLHIHWHWGEKYFFENLVDADIASNNGGWQWTAGTGTDASPYFRIFNPVLQARRFDSNGDYVRRFVPELARVPARFIHAPWEASPGDQRSFGCVIGKDYPAPIVDHAAEREVTLRMYGRSGTRGR